MSLLEMQGIDKAFNEVQVLNSVSLKVEEGEVHALLGENGAGKSTLMNILTGVLQQDAGEVHFDGKDISNVSIHQSEEIGIAFVHQELNLFNDMKVYENIFLGHEYTNKYGRIQKRKMIEEAKNLFEGLGVEINPNEEVSRLTTSQKQLLEISKALFFNSKLLILDEPTTSLNNNEIDHLFEIVNDLKKKGTAFIFISHKMPEIFSLADSYTVLRNGTYINSGKISDTTTDELISMMVGETYATEDIYKKRKLGETVLKLENYTGPGFKDVSFSAKKGEIIGLTGLQGAGSSELLSCMFGETKAYHGKLYVNNKLVPYNSIKKTMKARVALLPSNRKETSVIPDMSILENMYSAKHVLSPLKFHINSKIEKENYEKFKKLLNIKAASCDDYITSLSGGNQQKVFIARWLDTKADILMFDNPTQGIDVGAKMEIYKLILKLAEEGKTILINTLEIPEIKKIADRCIVFYDGHISGELQNSEIDEKAVMKHSTNAL